MKILLSCSGGMSSSLIAQGLEKEGKKRGQEVQVHATGTENVADDLNANDYDVVLLAPQSVYRKKVVEEEANNHDINFVMIPRNMYNPLATGKLLDLVEEELNK
ncbi:PTS fructose transporter subunit IIA [Lactobacillus sp. ESL0684]|uniref:PTS sugar transporter subunit IIB n=1 Tax=unclassified Lactobacillus TaxID=2620435 RepID=UPI0023FA44F9|nr:MULTISPECIES: PTS fructose transporter subunit IIA [unclassified Lactobacillus]WEV40212.1 PTS fructose transporter subunit IIA [Lactobacillus sp. ESL0681]WEV43263.1 PTS fructose transporter subunit IIA [Lactobacillus sp. ESL0684]